MAEVVTVPVLGKVKQSWLYVGGAAVAGIVGYAWWTRATVVEDEAFAVELPATEYEPPTVVDSNLGGPLSQGEPIARTNVEWRSMAQEQGEALGFTQQVMQSAISKYLGKARLTLTEAAAMAAVVAILGQPPTGGPYTIMEEGPVPTPTPTVPPAVTNLRHVGRTSDTHNLIAWDVVAGATSYRLVGQAAGHGPGGEWTENTNRHEAYRLGRGMQYTYTVWAVNAAGAGPKTSVTFVA